MPLTLGTLPQGTIWAGKAGERLSILGRNSCETSWRGLLVVVNTKEALQLEVGSVLGGPLHNPTPLEVPPNLLNIDAHTHTQSAPLPPLAA